jgi:NADPH:quinone reductase-like Zn-dependent oxidoreductase
MKAIVLPDYNLNIVRAMKSLEVREQKIPHPGPGQVLIKVAAAPCNPSDIAFMRGKYNILKPVPVTMGFECTGTVVDCGKAPQAAGLLGKRVSCFTQDQGQGTWAEYFLADWNNCIILDPDLGTDQAAALCVNPFTAYALFKMANERKCHTIVQNGASGQVGIFIRKLAERSGINIINIVRKAEHVDELKAEGENIVLNSAEADFETVLNMAALKNEACIAFDAVGGEMSGKILNALPHGSELVVYGGLSGKPLSGIETLEIIFRGKSIKGFNLGRWKEEIGPDKFLDVAKELQKLFIEGTLQTRIQGIFQLQEVQTAMEQYIRNMSAGKILFRPFAGS